MSHMADQSGVVVESRCKGYLNIDEKFDFLSHVIKAFPIVKT